MESQKFNLCWNEFDKAASTMLKNLVSDQIFTDVTISCDSDQTIQAHKIVLGSSSPVFRRMLEKNVHPHPMIHLRGVNFAILRSVIQFIYMGQTEVDQDHLPLFMSVAKDLEIRGLSENLDSFQQKVGAVNQFEVDSEEPELVEDQDLTEEDFTENKEEQEIEDPESIIPTFAGRQQMIVRYNQFITQEKNGERFYCDVEDCDFKTKSTSHLKLHKKSVHEGIKHQCDLCDRSYNFPGDLRRHKKTTHEGLRYPCHYCDFTASQTQTLKNHINKHHSYSD